MLALLLGLQQPPPMLVIDRLLFAYKSGKTWKVPDGKLGVGQSNLPFVEFGIGTAGSPFTVKEFNREEEAGGTYIQMDEGDDRCFAYRIKPSVPRKVETLPNTSKTYLNIAGAFLRGRGLKEASPRLMHVFRGDLDGDGTKEVLIEARSREDTADADPAKPMGNADYSFVLLRCREGKKVRERALRFLSFKKDKFLETTHILGVADLDGDGRMEIVTSGQGYEWHNVQLWSYRGGKVTKLLENGAGV